MADDTNNTRRGLLKALPFLGTAAAVPALSVAMPARTAPVDFDKQIDYHIKCIQLLQQAKYPHVKRCERLDLDNPDASGYGSIMLLTYRKAAV